MSSSTLPAAFWADLENSPYGHDLFRLLRWVDARAGARQRLGRASIPADEPVRLRQTPSLAFAPATLAKVRHAAGARPEVSIHSFGLFGPNGPLPLHLTEYARERAEHHQDTTLLAFSDIFHHRLILLFYRAWADAQSTASLDRPDSRFTRHVASLLNLGQDSLTGRDSIPDHAKYHMAGHLVRQTRNPEGLARLLETFFKVPVRLREFVPHWIRLIPAQRCALGAAPSGQPLGQGSVLGTAVRDAQHKFRLEIGPMTMAQYTEFLPGTRRARQLMDWVRLYVGQEFAWDVRLILQRDEVPRTRLGGRTPLGLGAWMGRRTPDQGDAGDLLVDLDTRTASTNSNDLQPG